MPAKEEQPKDTVDAEEAKESNSNATDFLAGNPEKLMVHTLVVQTVWFVMSVPTTATSYYNYYNYY